MLSDSSDVGEAMLKVVAKLAVLGSRYRELPHNTLLCKCS